MYSCGVQLILPWTHFIQIKIWIKTYLLSLKMSGLSSSFCGLALIPAEDEGPSLLKVDIKVFFITLWTWQMTVAVFSNQISKFGTTVCDHSVWVLVYNILTTDKELITIREHDDVTFINVHDITCQLISQGGRFECIQAGEYLIWWQKMLNS